MAASLRNRFEAEGIDIRDVIQYARHQGMGAAMEYYKVRNLIAFQKFLGEETGDAASFTYGNSSPSDAKEFFQALAETFADKLVTMHDHYEAVIQQRDNQIAELQAKLAQLKIGDLDRASATLNLIKHFEITPET